MPSGSSRATSAGFRRRARSLRLVVRVPQEISRSVIAFWIFELAISPHGVGHGLFRVEYKEKGVRGHVNYRRASSRIRKASWADNGLRRSRDGPDAAVVRSIWSRRGNVGPAI